jgi:hypothetical protein
VPLDLGKTESIDIAPSGTPNDQRLSAAHKTQAEAKNANAADKPCWTKPPGEGGMLGGWVHRGLQFQTPAALCKLWPSGHNVFTRVCV